MKNGEKKSLNGKDQSKREWKIAASNVVSEFMFNLY